jgi:hypothetical protein
MMNNNRKVSDEVHYGIPVRVREIVNGHLLILDEIIEDLLEYRLTLPTVSDLEACNVV